MAYRYETHLHTCQASACGISTGAEQARFYHEQGYRGIFVTDHFFGGNTAVPKNLPWEERVRMFCSGYEDALTEGQKIGLDVFFGWEQGYDGDEYLIYGLSPEWLMKHPEIETASRYEQYQLVHQAGGCVIQAHPFRDREYIRYVRLGLQFCDGIEAVNASNNPMNDVCALRYADEYHLICTAGSDNHHAQKMKLNPDWNLGGIEVETPLVSAKDFANRLLAREQPALIYNKARLDLTPYQIYHIESYWMDKDGRPLPTHRDWFK